MAKESQRNRFFEIFFLVLVVAVSVVFLRLLEPFFISLILAALAARIFWAPFSRLKKLFRNQAPPAALLTVLILTVVVILPLGLLGAAAYAELSTAYLELSERYEELRGEHSLLEMLRDLPVVGSSLEELDPEALVESSEEFLRGLGDLALNAFRTSFLGLAGGVAQTILMLLLVFFFLLDGPAFIDGIKKLLPLADEDFDRITNEAVRTAGATLRSTVVIGLGEGVFGTILFLSFGLPAPFLWGMIMVVFSMVPLVGTNFILVPASIILVVSGRPLSGLLMLAISLAVVSFSQNLVKPMLLGDSSGMHPALVLLATLGGIAWLGLVGFILGPVIASLFMVVWRLFSRYYTGADEFSGST